MPVRASSFRNDSDSTLKGSRGRTVFDHPVDNFRLYSIYLHRQDRSRCIAGLSSYSGSYMLRGPQRHLDFETTRNLAVQGQEDGPFLTTLQKECTYNLPRVVTWYTISTRRNVFPLLHALSTYRRPTRMVCLLVIK